jgi:hypothetical protein
LVHSNLLPTLLALVCPLSALAEHGQHHGEHHHPPPATAGEPPSEEPETQPGHAHEELLGAEPASHPGGGPLGIAAEREASGTTWQPDSTPMYARHFAAGKWSLMLHGKVFAGFDAQASPRGGHDWFGLNWFMLMATGPLGGGQLNARAMLTLEPFTVSDAGYPLLLQTGETFRGEPLHDRQHPHELFMELALFYAHPLGDGLAFQLYAAPVGEPALGPVAYPHRLSAYSDPLAPLGHHWQDSTHISFGVLTAGLFTRHFKLEGSWFNGREPDEDRTDFDLRTPDSYSARLWWNPAEPWSFQASYGFLKSPEAREPDMHIQRITASVAFNLPVLSRGNWASLAAWGRNVPSSDESTSDALLLETNLDLDGRNTLFGRAEYVLESGHHLALPHAIAHDAFAVFSVALGYLRDFGPFAGLVPGVGVRGALNVIAAELEPFYATRLPVGGVIFVRLRPSEVAMHGAGAPAHH